MRAAAAWQLTQRSGIRPEIFAERVSKQNCTQLTHSLAIAALHMFSSCLTYVRTDRASYMRRQRALTCITSSTRALFRYNSTRSIFLVPYVRYRPCTIHMNDECSAHLYLHSSCVLLCLLGTLAFSISRISNANSYQLSLVNQRKYGQIPDTSG